MSLDRLIEGIIKKQNPTVVGLDPLLEYLPDHQRKEAFSRYGETLEGAAAAIVSFNKGRIDALCDIVPAVKPQAAFYELLGWQGVKALAETIAYAKEKGMFVITDAKRGDIGSTMNAYAAAHLGSTMVGDNEYIPFGGDALTVNGYFGYDAIKPLMPFIEQGDKGIFVLVKTSNASSGEVQDVVAGESTIYGLIGDLCEKWGKGTEGRYGYSAVGAVAGATYPAELKEIRKRLPHTFLLVPGYGAQGGGAKDVAGAFDERGLGAVVNSSRGIITAWKKKGVSGSDYAEAAREEALRMKEDILTVIDKVIG